MRAGNVSVGATGNDVSDSHPIDTKLAGYGPLRYANLMQAQNFPDLLVAKFPQCPSRRAPVFNGVHRIFTGCAPFEVLNAIIALVEIDVINARQVVRIRYERFGDEPMHPKVSAPSGLVRETHKRIPALVDATAYDVATNRALNPSDVRDEVSSGNDWVPGFSIVNEVSHD